MHSGTQHQLHKARKRARAHKRRPKGTLVADINVTPLVDVVLVLLIIFMVVTPMITKGVAVDLPRTVHHDRKPDDGKDIIVSVTKDKQIYFATKSVRDVKDLIAQVENERRRHPDKTIYLKGDNRATYGTVREVMEAINKAGFEDIMLGTDDVKTSGGI